MTDNSKKKRKRGRPRKPGPNKGLGGAPKKMLTPQRIKEIENLAKLGLTEQQIFDAIGISRATFYKRKKEQPQLKILLARARASGIVSAAMVVRKKIEKGDLRAAMFFLKNRAGWNDKPKPQEETNSPEETASKLREMISVVTTTIHTAEKEDS